MPDSTYIRLTRESTPRRFSVVNVGRISLWQGNDHLLLVDRSGFTETYKRFYFRDIQAITIQKTSRRAIWNAVLAIPFGICLFGLIVSLTPPRNDTGMVVSIILVALTLVPIIINNLKGTACACQLRTAVQTENLGSLRRVRQAHKVLDKIRPLIAAAQGQLTAEEVSMRMHQAALSQAGVPSAQPATPSPQPMAQPVPAPPSGPEVPPVLS